MAEQYRRPSGANQNTIPPVEESSALVSILLLQVRMRDLVPDTSMLLLPRYLALPTSSESSVADGRKSFADLQFSASPANPTCIPFAKWTA
jgi:hypothetical protein